MNIFVTGTGVVSAIGLSVQENLLSLRSGITGIRESPAYTLMMAEVNPSNEQLIQLLGLPGEDFSRTTLLSLLAVNEAWGKNRIHDRIRTGIIGATSVGGLDRTEQYYFEKQNNNPAVPDQRMVFDNGGTTERIAAALGLSGYIGTISTACSSGANAIMQGARLIEANRLDRVIVGGADPLTIFNIKGFSSLNIYDPEICRPFDESRMGLNLGEGAGFLILENEHSLSITANEPVCLVSGWDNATDAYHQTASSPTGAGASITMKRALAKAKIEPGQISYVNAHGTGTANNDLSESIALKNVFGDTMPPFSSTKGFTGHTLAAAGAIESVYSVLAIQEKALFPNLNFTTPMKETGLVPESIYRSEMPIDHVLTNSFGFGGNCTSLIFSKIS